MTHKSNERARKGKCVRFSKEKKILAGFALTVAMLFTVGVLLSRSVSNQTNTATGISHTHEAQPVEGI